MDEKQDTCCAKVGEPFRMRECGDLVEYVQAGDLIFGGIAIAPYTGFYHKTAGHRHHAVSARWTQ